MYNTISRRFVHLSSNTSWLFDSSDLNFCSFSSSKLVDRLDFGKGWFLEKPSVLWVAREIWETGKEKRNRSGNLSYIFQRPFPAKLPSESFLKSLLWQWFYRVPLLNKKFSFLPWVATQICQKKPYLTICLGVQTQLSSKSTRWSFSTRMYCTAF